LIDIYLEEIQSNRSTGLRKNDTERLEISINEDLLNQIYIINDTKFITSDINQNDLKIAPEDYYMIINRSNLKLKVQFNLDISQHKLIYDPYKFEHSKKEIINPEEFRRIYNVPDGFIDVLSKWYSIKFTYPDKNLIYIKPEMGISIQTHNKRMEFWEILEGKPIIINGNKVHYFVDSGEIYKIPIGTFHSLFNPNKKDRYIVLKEMWKGQFDEEDIERLFSPNL